MRAPERHGDGDAAAIRLEAIGGGILRYGLVAILLYLGSFKFTATEAEGIRPLLANSPLLGWLLALAGPRGASGVIGVTELAIAALLASRPFAPRAAAVGGILAMGMFLTTLSFLVTTPVPWEWAPDFALPLPSLFGWFLLKDVFLLGAAIWCAGEAWRAASEQAGRERAARPHQHARAA
jgi:uncharacterized membrane protein YkgB